MKNSIFKLLIILATSTFLFAQENTVCPNIEIVGPSSSVRIGQVMNFSVSLVKEVENLDLKYNWDADKGKIIEGQGTSEITVSTEGLVNETLKASVEIEGLPKSCGNEFSENGIVVGGGHSYMFDEFENLKGNDIKARIDAFFIELQNNPKAKGYIINYGSAKLINRHEKLIKNHIKFRNYDENRLVFKNGGKEEGIRTKLWTVPEGANAEYLN